MSDTKDKLLTIVIPFYNTPRELIWRCLRSIPNDDRIKVEIYDDGSRDISASTDYVRWLAEEDGGMEWLDKCSKCKVTVLDKNIGLGAVRNLGVRSCKTRYIMFLDSDDTIDPQGLIDALDFIEEEKVEYQVLSRSIRLICGDEENVESVDKFLDQKMIPYFVTSNIYNVRLLKGYNIYFDESGRIFEDIPFSVKLWTVLLSDYSSEAIDKKDEVLYNYHLDSPSLTRVSKDKLSKLHDDAMYWINWIKEYYNVLTEYRRSVIKVYIFNRIRYEVEKAMEYKMKMDGSYDEFKVYLDQLKPYRIDKVLKYEQL